MGASLTKEGWTFRAGPGRTTAEVTNGLYRTIREAADDALIIGCNTVSHLSAGHFQICRIGDDKSGWDWARTRTSTRSASAALSTEPSTWRIPTASV